jgi:hypothetical protein
MRAFYFILATIAVVGIVPALYVGALFASHTGNLWFFPAVPAACVIFAGFCFARAEALM